jgi:hypothetical protein
MSDISMLNERVMEMPGAAVECSSELLTEYPAAHLCVVKPPAFNLMIINIIHRNEEQWYTDERRSAFEDRRV